MNDAELPPALVASLVRRLQASEQIERDGGGDGGWDRSSFEALGAREERERSPGHVLHDEQHLVAVQHDVVDRHDVRVRHARRDACLVEEGVNNLTIEREARVKTLDRNEPREATRADTTTDVHRGHPARADGSEEHVAAYRVLVARDVASHATADRIPRAPRS